ncbi:MAG: hypothetical protein ABI675_29155 [Chitinophagaceae bacterium]
MKKTIHVFPLVALCDISHFSSVQWLIKLPETDISDEPIGIDLTLKNTTLTHRVNLQYAEQGGLTGLKM